MSGALKGVLLPAVSGETTMPAYVVEENTWKRFIGAVSSGTRVKSALSKANMSHGSLEAALLDKKLRSQYDDAKTKALRIAWSEEVLEDVLVAIAMGATVKAACEQSFMEDKIDSFYRLMLRDPGIREAYDEARMIQAEKMAIDDVIEIADDKEKDETWDGKGNSAAVNRSRLMVDSRKWIAGKLHYKRFGDRQQVDVDANVVVDHAARLEAARKRKENAYAESKKKTTG